MQNRQLKTKIGSIISLFLFLCMDFCGFAQTFRASAPSVIGVGEQVRVTFTASSDKVSNYLAPSFGGLDVLSGPSTSRSSSYSIYNGQATSTSSTTFTYVVSATHEGTFTISRARANIAGKIVYSSPITIKVQKNPTQSQRRQSNSSPYQQYYNNQRQQAQHQQNPQQGRKQVTVVDNKAIFLRASANKSKAVLGEEIIITYKLYFLVNISEYQANSMPINKGFWMEEMDMSRNPVMSHEVVDGRSYNVVTLRKVLAYPQKSGSLVIPPLDIDVVALVPTYSQRGNVSTGDPFFDAFFNDPFFQQMTTSMSYQQVKKNIKSNSININVSALPKTTDSNFNGAVGSFSFAGKASILKCKTNEAVTLRYTISGNGNLSLIDNINLKVPSEFDSYDPTIDDHINKTQTGMNGSRTFEYIIIPRVQGEFKIPPVKFTYYDISSHKYKTLTSEGFTLSIAKGKDDGRGLSQWLSEREKYAKRDIESLQSGSANFTTMAHWSYDILLLVIIVVACAIVTAVYIVLHRSNVKKNSDITYVRFKKANKVVKKRLKKANRYLKANQKEAFYNEVAQSVWNYLADRFKIDKMSLSFEAVNNLLLQQGIRQQTVSELIDLLNNCEYVRFSQDNQTDEQKMAGLYSQAIKTLSDIEEQIK